MPCLEIAPSITLATTVARISGFPLSPSAAAFCLYPCGCALWRHNTHIVQLWGVAQCSSVRGLPVQQWGWGWTPSAIEGMEGVWEQHTVHWLRSYPLESARYLQIFTKRPSEAVLALFQKAQPMKIVPVCEQTGASVGVSKYDKRWL